MLPRCPLWAGRVLAAAVGRQREHSGGFPITRTGEEPSGAADLSPPLARAAVCLLALLAESMHSRLSIIPVGIAIFYSRLGLGQGLSLLLILLSLYAADGACLFPLLRWVRGGFPLLAGVVILTGLFRGTGLYLLIPSIWREYPSGVHDAFLLFLLPETLLWMELGLFAAWRLSRRARCA
ncbi:hypothetical protein [uncultured Desulfovibrio sp.]|uniref:hypothetical protein n=1 Tax=uncultured Desulfovibrio sp. TaxID=167968 RepID=UPI002608060B|nr:hypothetical protein [uncultured Desulfovibrio sp.]